MSLLDQFKERARSTTLNLRQSFAKAIEAGEKNPFTQTRVNEYLARQEGYSCFAALKTAFETDREPLMPAAEYARLQAKYPGYFRTVPDGVTGMVEHNTLLALSRGAVAPTLPAYLLLWHSAGTGSSNAVNAPTFDDLQEHLDHCTRYGSGAICFVEYLQIFPAPTEWAGRPEEYIKAHAVQWERQLTLKINKTVADVLSEVESAMEVAGENLFEGCVGGDDLETLLFNSHEVLLQELPPEVEMVVVGAHQNYIIGQLAPTVLVDAGTRSVYVQPFVLLHERHTALPLDLDYEDCDLAGRWFRARPLDEEYTQWDLNTVSKHERATMTVPMPPSLRNSHGAVMEIPAAVLGRV